MGQLLSWFSFPKSTMYGAPTVADNHWTPHRRAPFQQVETLSGDPSGSFGNTSASLSLVGQLPQPTIDDRSTKLNNEFKASTMSQDPRYPLFDPVAVNAFTRNVANAPGFMVSEEQLRRGMGTVDLVATNINARQIAPQPSAF